MTAGAFRHFPDFQLTVGTFGGECMPGGSLPWSMERKNMGQHILKAVKQGMVEWLKQEGDFLPDKYQPQKRSHHDQQRYSGTPFPHNKDNSQTDPHTLQIGGGAYKVITFAQGDDYT